MTDWDWLAQVDPVTIEQERFLINARTLKRREGVHLGSLATMPETDVRIIRAATRERQEAQAENAEKSSAAGRIRDLEATLNRERREHARALAWQKKLTTLGRSTSGPFPSEAA